MKNLVKPGQRLSLLLNIQQENMPQLTQEQLKIIQEKAKPIFEHLQRKKALEWARQLERPVADLEMTDRALFAQYQKLIAQLKWVACPLIKDDQEFLELIEKHFLEVLALDVNLIDLVTTKLELQFGVDLEETINEILLALRKNKQSLGNQPMSIKGESTTVKPWVKNWLLDFIRSVKVKNPSQVEEADYLFNNQNAKKLSESDRETLGKLLTFYNTFKLYADGLTLREKATPSRPSPPVTPVTPSPFPSRPAPLPAQPSPVRPLPPSPPEPAKPEEPARRDIYQEPVEEPPEPGQVEPKIEGNVVDLKNK